MDPIILTALITSITSVVIVITREVFNHVKKSECTKEGIKFEMSEKKECEHK